MTFVLWNGQAGKEQHVGHSKADKTDSHERILEVAARRFRERGFDGVGLAELMEEAGLTMGGFYKHFASRDALLAAATARAFDSADRRMAKVMPDARQARLEAFLDAYLGPSHRDNPGNGCVVATLAMDAARNPAAREVFATHFYDIADQMAALLSLSGKGRRATGAAVIAAMAGAVAVARAVDDRELSDAILDAARKLIISAVSTDARKAAAKVKIRPDVRRRGS
jgi:TetR/AcrR family transcriptional repressor of nem operon